MRRRWRRRRACAPIRSIDGFAGENARAWLLAITRNAAFTHMSRNRPRSVVTASDPDDAQRLAEAVPDPAASPEAVVIARADSDALERALAALAPPFREVVVLREYNDLSYREIAEITRSPIGTVMSRLARARAMLVAALAPDYAGGTNT